MAIGHIVKRSWLALAVVSALWLLQLPQSVLASGSLRLDSSHIVFHFHGPTDTSRIGRTIGTIGDINNDGYDDIYVSCNHPRGTYVFFGGNPPDTFPDMFIKGSVWGAIDLTGDGIRDVYSSSLYWNPLPMSTMYFFRGYGDSLASVPYDSIYTDVFNYGFGRVMRADYIDGDSMGDMLVCAPDYPEGPRLYYYRNGPSNDTVSDWSFCVTGNSHDIGGADDAFGFIDWDGDGEKDVYVGLRTGLDTVGRVYIFLGPTFAQEPDVIIRPLSHIGGTPYKFFAQNVFNVGDVDGDGWSDLGVDYIGTMLIYKCGPGADTIYDYRLPDYLYQELGSVGDVNGDGFGDLAAGLYGWIGGVDLYLGGPRWDTVRDGWLRDYDLPPDLLEAIGWQIASAGDFNGDGIGDFIFSCRNLCCESPGDVYVAKGGTDIVTDVNETATGANSESLILLPGYPNPFNPSTTIAFELSVRSPVSIQVYNVLGQRVATLADATMLQAGKHEYTWDGMLSGGKRAPSGAYIFRVSTPSAMQSRKVMLIK